MSEPKKHHIVPRMLLKHFALDGKICLYSKKSESFRFDQGIENVCIQKITSNELLSLLVMINIYFN